MNMGTRNEMWQAFFSLGGIAGALSLIWQLTSAFRNRLRRPQLRILDLNRKLDIFSFEPGPGDKVRFVTVQVQNIGRQYASRCIARARIRPLPGTEARREVALHWADTPVIYRTTGESHVDIAPGGQWRLDVAFAKPSAQVAWLATESALYGNFFGDAELPPAQHDIELRVTFEDGNDAVRLLRITSSQKWDELDATFDD
jgi:hypothetical protein